MNRRFLYILIPLALLTGLSFYRFSGKELLQEQGTGTSGIKVTDFRGAELTLEKPASRIVCLIESALSGLYMLDAGGQIAGIPSQVYSGDVFSLYSVLDERIARHELPAPGNWDFVKMESVIGLNPDLVIIWSSQVEAIETLESHSVKVYAVMLHSVADVYKEITDLGILTGRESRADSLITICQEEIGAIQKTLGNKQAKPQQVYFAWSQGILETSGLNSMVNEVIQMAGAENVCKAPEEHLVVNKEQLLAWDPGMILLWNNNRLDPEDVAGMSELKGVKAIRDKRVYELPTVFWCDMWTLKFCYTVKLIASWSYPEKFPDFDPVKERAAITGRFYGKSFSMELAQRDYE